MKNRKIYPWIVVGLLWFVALLNYMDRQMLSTMKDAMQIDIIELQSATNFGRLMAVFLWIYGLMSPMAMVCCCYCIILRERMQCGGKTPPKTPSICKKSYNFFLKKAGFPLTALL